MKYKIKKFLKSLEELRKYYDQAREKIEVRKANKRNWFDNKKNTLRKED